MSDYISEDIVYRILRYLPVKTLIRFQSVCKRWKELIDCPNFVQDHLSVQKPQFIVEYGGFNYLVVVDPLPCPLTYTLSKPIQQDPHLLVGTFHGVVCLFSWTVNIVIWNPSIRRCMSFPRPWKFTKWFIPVQACYGFWIDSSTKEFKILMLYYEMNCFFYSSIRGGDSVIPITEKLKNWRPHKEGPPVMIGGVAHWGGWEHERAHKVILSFDFVQESFDVIEMPDLRYYNTAPCRWQGKLSLLCWDDQYPCRCEIYLRKEDLWAKMFSFKVFGRIRRTFWAMEDTEEMKKKGRGNRKRKMGLRMEETTTRDLIGDSGDGQKDVRLLAAIGRNELVLNGPKTGFKVLGRRLRFRDHEKLTMAYDFVESLLFP